jgi:crotonobetainyl-CoA:carnitine CoA-transferase CaiB-like acyl-CoA transferase
MFNSVGRNKRSFTVNLRTPEGVALVSRLAKLADVVVENNAPGLLDRLGLGPRALCALNPALIYLSMPVFGSGGPYAGYQGFGANAEAIAGLTALRGYRDGDYSALGRTNHMDTASGAGAAFAVMVALAERERSGRGQYIEFSQIENLIFHFGETLMDAAMNGRVPAPPGNRDPWRAPQGVYPCRGEDRWIALSVGSDGEWAGLCAAMGRPEWVEAPEYAGNAARRARHDTLDRAIADWTRDQDNRALMNQLQACGVPAAIAAHDEDVFRDPHLRARGFYLRLAHPEAGTHDYPGYPYRWPGMERPATPPPCLGGDNEYVYKELLGFTDAEYADWEAMGQIGRDYLL